MHKNPAAEDLRVFTAVVRKASFGGAATELGTSPAYVSKGVLYIVQLLHGFVASAASLMRALPSSASSRSSPSNPQES